MLQSYEKHFHYYVLSYKIVQKRGGMLYFAYLCRNRRRFGNSSLLAREFTHIIRVIRATEQVAILKSFEFV